MAAKTKSPKAGFKINKKPKSTVKVPVSKAKVNPSKKRTSKKAPGC